MISQTKNRVQAIKSKFENLTIENDPLIAKKKLIYGGEHLNKHNSILNINSNPIRSNDKENENGNSVKYVDISSKKENNSESDSDDLSPTPNPSYLYSKTDIKRSASDAKTSLTRQSSDPGKKLHRSHAFRCDRSQKIGHSPKRHGSCNGRSETSDFSLKMADKKLSKDRLKRLGNLLEDQMRKENFVPSKMDNSQVIVGEIKEVNMPDSIPDSEVPRHILDQYAKVLKPKKNDIDSKQDAMTDSGVSSETENLDEEKNARIKQLRSQFENSDSLESVESRKNLETMTELCASSETMRLERKNPHLKLTDTLKKALKQPLPPGPPPKKPPRTFNMSPINESTNKRKDTRQMLEKLEKVLQKREADKNIYDIAETDLSVNKPKEIHYLCTKISDITQRTLLPNQNVTESITNCFNSLNCAIISNSSSSLPYTQFNNDNGESIYCSCTKNSNNSKVNLSTFSNGNENKCMKCQSNEQKHGFKCHLNCKCRIKHSEFYVEKENIYDVPFCGKDGDDRNIERLRQGSLKSKRYGTLNILKQNHSKSLEDLRVNNKVEAEEIYDIPCDTSRPTTPEFVTSSPKSNFERLRENFENGFRETDTKTNMELSKPTTTEQPIDTKKTICTEKPVPLTPKPIIVNTKIKVSKSTENLCEAGKLNLESKFATDTKRYRKWDKNGNGLKLIMPKNKNSQLEVDRKNLSRLMTEIYETVTAVCNMDDQRPGSFPTEQSDSTSEDSVKLTRSLTEKRKNYVRRVSSRVAYLDAKNVKSIRFRHQTSVCSYKSEIIDNPYSTFRSWKSFRASQNNLSKESTMAADRRDSTDSKFNLTDSSGNILSMRDDFSLSTDFVDHLSIDEKTGCVDIELPFEPRDRGVFNICLLVGLNYMTGEAYVKSVFPSQVQVPPHIENLIFPETLSSASKGEWSAEARGAQCYSLVLTDERGERSYGYCRRVLPEGATTCLPLCYCIIGKYRAPGFYYKILQEIESHHGSSEVEIHSILQQLFETEFPNPGEEITITYKIKRDELSIHTSTYRNSVNLGDILKSKTMPDPRRSCGSNDDSVSEKCESLARNSETRSGKSETRSGKSDNQVRKSENDSETSESVLGKDGSQSGKGESLPDFYDWENNNKPKRMMLSFEGKRTKIIKRPIEPRVDEDNLSVLLDTLGAGLLIKVFGSLLLERKVIIIGDQLSVVSSCLEGLQSALYPLAWQQPLISIIPAEIRREALEAPLPMLAGALVIRSEDYEDVAFEEGILIDLTNPSKVIFYQGDESTILPTSSYKTLKTSLQMESIKQKDKHEDRKTRNVMISEAFLRFFVDILGDFWRFFFIGELKEGSMGKGDVVFDKDAFIKSASSKQNQYFLEWFTETAMFNHFVQNMAACHHARQQSPAWPNTPSGPNTPNPPNMPNTPNSPQTEYSTIELVDTPLPNFYELFEDRVRSRNKTNVQKNVEGKHNYKNAVNKKVKLLKSKLRDLVT